MVWKYGYCISTKLGKEIEAIKVGHRALRITEDTKDKNNHSRWLGSIISPYSQMGMQSEALAFGFKSLDMAKDIKDKRREKVLV